jgi:hypothetical protein
LNILEPDDANSPVMDCLAREGRKVRQSGPDQVAVTNVGYTTRPCSDSVCEFWFCGAITASLVTGKPRVTENDSTKADLCCVATKKTPSD